MDSQSSHLRWLLKLEPLLIAVLVLVVLPAVLLDGMLVLERFLEIGLYDVDIGGDPAWRSRPLLTPLLVVGVAVTRLVLARGRAPVARGPMVAYWTLLVVAALTAAFALIPEPNIFRE